MNNNINNNHWSSQKLDNIKSKSFNRILIEKREKQGTFDNIVELLKSDDSTQVNQGKAIIKALVNYKTEKIIHGGVAITPKHGLDYFQNILVKNNIVHLRADALLDFASNRSYIFKKGFPASLENLLKGNVFDVGKEGGFFEEALLPTRNETVRKNIQQALDELPPETQKILVEYGIIHEVSAPSVKLEHNESANQLRQTKFNTHHADMVEKNLATRARIESQSRQMVDCIKQYLTEDAKKTFSSILDIKQIGRENKFSPIIHGDLDGSKARLVLIAIQSGHAKLDPIGCMKLAEILNEEAKCLDQNTKPKDPEVDKSYPKTYNVGTVPNTKAEITLDSFGSIFNEKDFLVYKGKVYYRKPINNQQNQSNSEPEYEVATLEIDIKPINNQQNQSNSEPEYEVATLEIDIKPFTDSNCNIDIDIERLKSHLEALTYKDYKENQLPNGASNYFKFLNKDKKLYQFQTNQQLRNNIQYIAEHLECRKGLVELFSLGDEEYDRFSLHIGAGTQIRQKLTKIVGKSIRGNHDNYECFTDKFYRNSASFGAYADRTGITEQEALAHSNNCYQNVALITLPQEQMASVEKILLTHVGIGNQDNCQDNNEEQIIQTGFGTSITVQPSYTIDGLVEEMNTNCGNKVSDNDRLTPPQWFLNKFPNLRVFHGHYNNGTYPTPEKLHDARVVGLDHSKIDSRNNYEDCGTIAFRVGVIIANSDYSSDSNSSLSYVNMYG